MDGWGMWLIRRRLAEIYSALARGAPHMGEPFGDWTSALQQEQAYRSSAQFAADRRYWLERFADRAEPVSFVDRPATPSERFLRQTAYLFWMSKYCIIRASERGDFCTVLYFPPRRDATLSLWEC